MSVYSVTAIVGLRVPRLSYLACIGCTPEHEDESSFYDLAHREEEGGTFMYVGEGITCASLEVVKIPHDVEEDEPVVIGVPVRMYGVRGHTGGDETPRIPISELVDARDRVITTAEEEVKAASGRLYDLLRSSGAPELYFVKDGCTCCS